MESPDLALCMNNLFCQKCNTQIAFIHAFKMADKIARKEGHRQLFVEYLNEIAHNSRDASFLSDEDFTEVAFATIQSPENKNSLLTLNHCLGSAEILVLNNCQPYF